MYLSDEATNFVSSSLFMDDINAHLVYNSVLCLAAIPFSLIFPYISFISEASSMYNQAKCGGGSNPNTFGICNTG